MWSVRPSMNAVLNESCEGKFTMGNSLDGLVMGEAFLRDKLALLGLKILFSTSDYSVSCHIGPKKLFHHIFIYFGHTNPITPVAAVFLRLFQFSQPMARWSALIEKGYGF